MTGERPCITNIKGEILHHKLSCITNHQHPHTSTAHLMVFHTIAHNTRVLHHSRRRCRLLDACYQGHETAGKMPEVIAASCVGDSSVGTSVTPSSLHHSSS